MVCEKPKVGKFQKDGDSVNILKWLEEWYESNCDGDWEHQFGISIETLDNPGWLVKLNVNYTLYENIPFDDIEINRSEHDWVMLSKRGNRIECAGGPRNLEELLKIIKKWMEDNKPDSTAINTHTQDIMNGRKFRDMDI